MRGDIHLERPEGKQKGAIEWMLPPRGTRLKREHHQRLTMVWGMPDIIIYEPKPKGAYDLLIRAGAHWKILQIEPTDVDRESARKNWGRVFIGHRAPISVMEYNAITVTEWRL